MLVAGGIVWNLWVEFLRKILFDYDRNTRHGIYPLKTLSVHTSLTIGTMLYSRFLFFLFNCNSHFLLLQPLAITILFFNSLNLTILDTSYCCCCSVAKSCQTLCDPVDCGTPGFPVLHHLPEFAQIHVHWVGDAIQPSCPLSPPSPFAFNLSQHRGLFQWVSSLHQVAKVLEL